MALSSPILDVVASALRQARRSRELGELDLEALALAIADEYLALADRAPWGGALRRVTDEDLVTPTGDPNP